MKRGIIIILLISILLISPLVLAQELNQTEEQTELEEQTQFQEQTQTKEQTPDQEQAQAYSGINRLTDNVKLAFSGRDNKVELALEIREKEVDSAINNIQNQEENKAIKNLERAKKKLEIVQEKVSLDTSEEIKTSVEKIINKINTNPALPEVFDDYLLEEQKTELTAVLTEKTYEYCEELAKEDFALMLKEEECNPDTAIPGLEKELRKLKDLQYRMFIKLMLEIRSCIDDPGTCNCEANNDTSEKAKCEKMVALAVKCEYKEDETSCDELEAMKPSPGDGFARSFVPDFLMSLFAEKYKMIEYGIEPSDSVPEACWDDNDKPECKKYDNLKENNLDWDEYGNYKPILHPGKKPSSGGTEETIPTMEESVPECFDEEGNFLEEKCGKITVVWNEEGLVNYIVKNQVDAIIDEFENKSKQHLMEIRSGWMMVENKWVIDKGQMNDENWTIDEGNWTISTKAREIKQDMNQINNQIKDITYAPGTEPDGDGRVVVDEDRNGGYAPGTGPGGGSNVVAGDNSGDNVIVIDEDITADSGIIDNRDSGSDSGGNDIDNTVDPGPDGIVGVIVPEPRGDGDGSDSNGDSGGDSAPVTGDVTKEIKSRGNFLTRIFGR